MYELSFSPLRSPGFSSDKVDLAPTTTGRKKSQLVGWQSLFVYFIVVVTINFGTIIILCVSLCEREVELGLGLVECLLAPLRKDS